MHLSIALYKEEMDQHPLPAHQVSIKVSLQTVPAQTQNLSSLVKGKMNFLDREQEEMSGKDEFPSGLAT